MVSLTFLLLEKRYKKLLKIIQICRNDYYVPYNYKPFFFKASSTNMLHGTYLQIFCINFTQRKPKSSFKIIRYPIV